MENDEAGPDNLLSFQKEVLTDFDKHLSQRSGDEEFDWDTGETVRPDSERVQKRERELEEAAREWCRENDVKPEHLENSLVRYSENFSPVRGGKPLKITE